MFCSTGETGTLHLFSLEDNENQTLWGVKYIKSFTDKLSYEWSKLNIKFGPLNSPYTICGFVDDKKICTISECGEYKLFEIMEDRIIEKT